MKHCLYVIIVTEKGVRFLLFTGQAWNSKLETVAYVPQCIVFIAKVHLWSFSSQSSIVCDFSVIMLSCFSSVTKAVYLLKWSRFKKGKALKKRGGISASFVCLFSCEGHLTQFCCWVVSEFVSSSYCKSSVRQDDSFWSQLHYWKLLLVEKSLRN